MQIKKSFLTIITLILALSVPLSSSAATSKISGSATFDESSLISSKVKPTITGEAEDVKTVRINIYKEGSTKAIYKSKAIKVKNGDWKAKVTKKIPNGEYDIAVYGPKGVTKHTLATSTLVIDTDKKTSSKTATKANTTFVIESLPLLAGGTARQQTSVPVSYLQVTNIGKEPAVLKGFWVKQNGNANAQSVIGFSTADDSGLIRNTIGGVDGTTPFKNNVAFVPTTDITFAAGQLRLITIKAIMAHNTASYVGTNLMIDVTSADTTSKIQGKFPIKGTTWTIAR